MSDISFVSRRSRACRIIKAVLPICLTSVLLLCVSLAQETTRGLQGTVKDPSGAVVAKALVELKGASLVGSKTQETDGSGYYHFVNLPPGTYGLIVTAQGFTQLKRDGINIAVDISPRSISNSRLEQPALWWKSVVKRLSSTQRPRKP
jgi:hypothetical protein